MPLLRLCPAPDLEHSRPKHGNRADSIAVPVAFGQLQLLTGRLSVGAHEPGTLFGCAGLDFSYQCRPRYSFSMPVLRLPMRRRLPLLAFLLFWNVGCNDSQPGEIEVFLVSPNGLEAAVIVELDGVFDQISAPASAVVFSEVVDGRTRVAIIMRTYGDVWFSVFVPSVSDPPQARVLEVAGPKNEIRDDVESYALQFGR